RVWEQDLLPARVENYEREWLDRLGLAGEMVWTVFDRAAGDRGRSTRVGAALRENVGWLREGAAAPPEMDARVKNVFLHLQLRGASFAQDLARATGLARSEEHTSELQSRGHLVCRLLLEKKKNGERVDL